MKFAIACCIVVLAVTIQAAPQAPVAVQPVPPMIGTVASQYHSQDELGQARFGYAHPGQSAVNYRDAFGNQIGSYAYFNPDGKEVRVSYTADHRGFRVLSNDLPVAAQETPEVAQAKAAHFAAKAALVPVPVAPAPVAPAPVAPAPAAPAPVAPAPVAPAPAAPAPAAPAPVAPAPVAPAPVAPVPVAAPVAAPVPVVPAAIAPAPFVPNIRYGTPYSGFPGGFYPYGSPFNFGSPFGYRNFNFGAFPYNFRSPFTYPGNFYGTPYGIIPPNVAGSRAVVKV